MMIRSIQQIGPIRPVMIEKTPTLNLNALADFIFLMILLFVIYQISESVIRRTPGYTKEDKKIPIYQIICIIVVSSLQIGFGWSEELVKGIILLLISLYASVSDIQTHRVKDIASVMILITGFIGITVSEIPKHFFDGLLIGGILFMVGATFISSWNPDSFARMGNLEDGEYYITINHNTLVNPKPYGISEYQVNTPFSQELMEELQQIPEVKEIYATERTAAIIEYHDEQLEIPIIPITPDNQEEILKTLPVDWTYETLVKQDAMVILGTSVQKEVYHACPSIGEKVTLRWFDGAEHSIDILIAGTSEKSMNEGFYLPKETIEKLWGDMDLTASLTLSVPEYEKVGKSVESKLNNILSRHPDLVMETLQEVKASSANTIHNTSVQVYGVSAFVIMFSIFNLTNTLISRISTRRKEFGILESIGMTKKQIKKMLLHESVLLIIPCLIITVVAGTLMGYLLVRILSANGLTYFQYTFPFIPLLIYGVCLIITPIIISAICLKIQCRNSLVERIKMAD